MRVGIIIEKLDSEVISGSHFEQAIINQLSKINDLDNFKFIIIAKDIGTGKVDISLDIIDLKNFTNRINQFPKSKLSKIFKTILKRLSIVRNSSYLNEIFLKSPLQRAISDNKIDVVWNIYSNEEVDVPYIATCLDCYDLVNPYLPENNNFINWVSWNRKATDYYRKATFIVVSTKILRNQVIKFYGVSNEKIIINPFFTPVLNTAVTTFQSDDTKEVSLTQFLFYPSRYTPQKNHIVLFEALKILKNNYNFRPKLILCGKDCGNLEFLKIKAIELNISEQIEFLGLIDFQFLVQLYKNAKALVYCSFVGPDNLPPLEAFSLDCPVIASRVSGAVEQLKDAVLLFEPTNEFELVEHILSIYNNEELVNELISKGRNIANNLSVDKYVTKILTYLNDFKKIQRAWK